MSYLQISQNSKNKEFKEKGKIDVTPYLDKSDGGTGYSPPLSQNNQLLIGVLVTLIVLFLVIAKLGILGRNSNSSDDEISISELTPRLDYSKENKSSEEIILTKNPKKRSLFSNLRKFTWKFPFIKVKVAQDQSLKNESDEKE